MIEAFADLDASYSFSTAPPDFAQLLFADQSARFRSITVNNQSSRLIGIFLNATGAGAPNFSIAPGTYVTQPVASSEFASLRFWAPKGGVDSGTVYVHACNQILTASSGIVAAGSAGGIVFDYSAFDTGAAFSQ